MIDRHLVEKLEMLDGSRGPRSDRKKAAVRIEDLAPILELPPTLKSVKAAGDPPTQAEFNALVDDIAALHQRLTIVAQLLQARIIR